MSNPPLPTVFVPHGGGPWPHMKLDFLPADEGDALLAHMRSVSDLGGAVPEAVLVISAHFEAPVATVTTGASPDLLFDYYNFPPEAYRYRWPAPGSPELARRVRGLLEGAGLATAEDPDRGFDHGTFIPLMAAWPQVEVPVVQLSLLSSMDPAAHLRMGRALAPLRDEGVYIVGSGNSFHNLRALFGERAAALVTASVAFDDWLAEAVTSPEAERNDRLAQWSTAPSARACHPREEHLLPLMVVAGAAGADPGRVQWSGTMAGFRISAHQFGGV